jgi:LPXTG-motif cell wall-anchored protein
MRRIWMLLVLGLTSVVVVVLGASAAAADQYPPTPPAQGPPSQLTPPPAGGGRALSFTGSDTMPLVWIGLAALVAGTLLVVAARRRVRSNRRLLADY